MLLIQTSANLCLHAQPVIVVQSFRKSYLLNLELLAFLVTLSLVSALEARNLNLSWPTYLVWWHSQVCVTPTRRSKDSQKPRVFLAPFLLAVWSFSSSLASMGFIHRWWVNMSSSWCVDWEQLGTSQTQKESLPGEWLWSLASLSPRTAHRVRAGSTHCWP